MILIISVIGGINIL